MERTRHPKIFIGKIAAYAEEKMQEGLKQLACLCRNGSERELRAFLGQFLPEAQLADTPPPASDSVLAADYDL
jgi:hypothetical protein